MRLRDEEHLVADGGAQGDIDFCQRFAVDEAAASESRGRGERNLLEGIASFEALGAYGLDFFAAEAQQAVAGVHAECGGHSLLLDCGEGTQTAARRAGVNLMRADAICFRASRQQV